MKPLYLLALGVVQLAFLTPQKADGGSATWKLNPTSDDWNTGANWTPSTVPNGPNDIATFDSSNATSISLSAVTTVKQIGFGAGASAYTIATTGGHTLTLAGTGIVNTSGLVQQFVAGRDENNDGGIIQFTGAASAGSLSYFDVEAPVLFLDRSSAEEGVFLCHAGTLPTEFGGSITLGGSASAGNASITLEGGNIDDGLGGTMFFKINSSAGNGAITAHGGSVSGADGATVTLSQSATADHALFVANGGAVSGGGGAIIDLRNTAIGGDATFVINGGQVAGAAGAELVFVGSSEAAQATISVNGGTSGGAGGECAFGDISNGGNARVKIFGNGLLSNTSTKPPTVTVGSIEGDGIIAVGQRLSVGSNNLDTIFSGTIGGIGELIKVGTGSLTLSGANTFAQGATVSEGALIISNTAGSGTGNGPVQVDGGTLGGGGIIAGTVTIGTGSGRGAFLAPAGGTNRPATLTIQSALTFNSDATYTYTFKARPRKTMTDTVIANGVRINSGASFNFSGTLQGKLRRGTVFTVISNTAATPIAGAFANLPDGAILGVNNTNFQASYQGGDGNDLTLTVVP